MQFEWLARGASLVDHAQDARATIKMHRYPVKRRLTKWLTTSTKITKVNGVGV